MSRRSNAKDPSEGIRQVLGKHVKILLKVNVKLEKGGDKTDPRILVFSPHRLFVLTAKVPPKIDHHFHYLDIQSIESKKHNQVVFKINDRNYAFRPAVETSTSDAIDVMIITLANAIRSVFPGVMLSHVIPKVEVVPVKRIQSVLETKPLDLKDMGPCGGFSTQYACMCDYFNLPYREEVAWDVDTIYYSHDSHELCLTDFEHLEQRDLICIISALEHNTWFTKLRASSNTNKLANEVIDRVLSVVNKSMSLQEIHLPSIGVRWEFVQRLAAAMSSNQYCNLTSIDVSLNFIEDRGLTSLATVMAKLPRGPRHINLSHTTITGKGVNSLAQSLVTNKLSLNSLTYLNLAGNSLREDVSSLCSFLAQPNVVSILDLASTDIPAEILFSALVRGCTNHLTHLNLARNPFTSKKSKGDIPATFKQFFATTLCLQYLNMSHGKLPLEALKHLLLGLACNEATSDVELNISSNNLGAGGAGVLENCLPGIKCVTRLDLSDNNIDMEMASVVTGVSRNRSLVSVNLSKNLPKVKPRDVVHVMESIVQLIQEEDTVLQKLNLSDCKLKTDINNVINALGSNQCLQVLDISGNAMGDVGARLLAKALQINTRLKTVHLDRNNISLQGYQDITYALQFNYSMRHIPFPTYDMQPAMKTSPERVDAITRRMQELLQRNSSPKSFGGRNQAFRLTQGFLLSSTQQVLDRWVAQTQDTIETVRRDCTESNNDIDHALGLIHDAEKCKVLQSSLHDVTTKKDESGGMSVNNKLYSLATDLSEYLVAHIDQNVESMLGAATDLCPHVLSPESRSLVELRNIARSKARIPPEFVTNLVQDTIGQEIINKVNEVNLILANHIADKVIDDVIDNLSKSHKTLCGDLGSYKKKRSLTPDVLKGSSQHLDREILSQGGSDNQSQKSESSPLTTPHLSKRKSMHDRKLRPKSTVLDNNAEDYAPDLLTNMARSEGPGDHVESEDAVPELPAIPQLQHLAKNRPKRNKKHAATKSMVLLQQPPDGGESDDIKEGLDKFFTATASPSLTPIASPHQVASPSLEDTHPSRLGSISSTSSSQNVSPSLAHARSREDLRPPGRKTSSLIDLAAGRRSPADDLSGGGGGGGGGSSGKHRGGLSCLMSQTLDEDTEPVARSPEKKPLLSPSGRSISDIFGKVAQEKVAKSRGLDITPPGTSPFTTRRSETEIFTSKRRSFFNSDGVEIRSTDKSPDSESLATSPDSDVVKRPKGVGLGGNVLAEMKSRQEKRASVVPRTDAVDGVEVRSDKEVEENPFGQVKLRSTGLASNLTSPVSEFSPDQPVKKLHSPDPEPIYAEPEKIKHSSSSIIGLRAAAEGRKPVSSSNMNKSVELNEEGSVDSSPVTPGETDKNVPKPRPPPKPRPWSIVGVDRKSGEFTQVEGGGCSGKTPEGEVKSVEEECDEGEVKKRVGSVSGRPNGGVGNRGSVRDMIASLNKPEPAGAGTVGGLLGGGSVRDRIANMNKGGEVGGGSVGGSEPVRRKGNSLPRNVNPAEGPGLAKSPSTRRVELGGSSPKTFKKESTCDDPRILKLEDDFMYDDSVNV